MQIEYLEIGICGLSCELCPTYNTNAKSKCDGCKSNYRIGAGCPFITCALKKKGIEFCWLCEENETCEKWSKHRAAGKERDSFKCYQTLEKDINLIKQSGIEVFSMNQKTRAKLLLEMLNNFNEGRSKTYYCIVATVLEIDEIEKGLSFANREIEKQGITGLKVKSKILHSFFDNVAHENGYLLKLRK